MLSDGQKLILSKSTVVRNNAENTVLFNSVTDEMYTISNNALGIIDLCDGEVTINQIETFISNTNKDFDTKEGRTTLKRFFQEMVDRGILKVIEAN